MKITIIIAGVITSPFLTGCTGVFHLMGARYCHHSTCAVEDSRTNRQTVVEIVTSVGGRHGMSDNTEQWREGMLRFAAPLRHDTNDEVISFVVTNRNTEASGICLRGYHSGGKLLVEIQQVRWSGKRSASYHAIHSDLVPEIRRRFGESATFAEVDHLLL